MSRHMLSYMSKFTRILFHLVVLCDSLRCGAYGTYCYGISCNVITISKGVCSVRAKQGGMVPYV